MDVVGVTGKCVVTKALEADDKPFDPSTYSEEQEVTDDESASTHN